MDNTWFYEYTIKFWDDSGPGQEAIRSGLVVGETMTEVVTKLEEYYGELMDIQTLKPITDYVFEFQHVTDNTDFDFLISKKV
jgi:hypothetical protein